MSARRVPAREERVPLRLTLQTGPHHTCSNARRIRGTALSKPAVEAPMRATRILPAALILSSVLGAGCTPGSDASGDTGAGDQGTCDPLESRRPEEPDYKPTFEGQTRVCGVRSNVAFDVVVVARGLQQPWAVEPLRGGG